MKSDRQKSRRKTLAVAGLLGALVAFAGGCGGDDKSGSGDSSGGEGASKNVEYATSQVEAFTPPPKFKPLEGAMPFDASKLRGKRVMYIPIGSQFQIQKVMIPIQRRDFEKHGIEFTEFVNQGTPTEWSNGVQQAITQDYDAIVLSSNNPRLFAPALKRANEAGIPVIDSISQTPDNGPPPGVKLAGQVFIPAKLPGRLQADWVISKTDGKAHVLIANSSDFIPSKPQVDAIKAELKARCGSACSWTEIDVPVADWAQKMQGEVRSALVANPDINYVLPLFSAQQQWVVPAIQAVGGAGRIKSVGAEGTPLALDMMREGDMVEADVGFDFACAVHMTSDAAMRALAGLEPVSNVDPESGDVYLPLRMWSDDNVKEAGVPATFVEGYGGQCADYYDAIWSNKPAP